MLVVEVHVAKLERVELALAQPRADGEGEEHALAEGDALGRTKPVLLGGKEESPPLVLVDGRQIVA
jgi:hypothetical protein